MADKQMVDPLTPLRRVFAGKNRRQVVARPLQRRPGGRHWMALRTSDAMEIFRPEDDPA